MGGKMGVAPSERGVPDPLTQGPEVYAPSGRRGSEDPTSGARAAFLRRQTAEHRRSDDPSTENLYALIHRISAGSTDEIDHVIRELESLRAVLRNEGGRVRQQVAGYASLCQASMTAMKIIANSLKVSKDSPDGLAR
jgi:hypothetical protein